MEAAPEEVRRRVDEDLAAAAAGLQIEDIPTAGAVRAAGGAEAAARALSILRCLPPSTPGLARSAGTAGRLLLRENRAAEAEAAFALAEAAGGLGADAAFDWAAWLIRRGRTKEAVARLGAASAADGSPLTRYRLAASSGDWAAAARLGGELTKTRPSTKDMRALYWPFPVSDHDTRGPAAAYRAFLEKSLRRAPKGLWTDHFRAALSLADFPERTARRLPGTPRAWMLWKTAMLALGEGRPRESARAFLAAAAGSRPGDWIAQYRGAEMLLCAGDAAASRRAETRGDAMARAEGRAAEALAWKAALRLWTGRAKEALALAETARAGGALYASGTAGAALVLLGRPAEALALLEERIASGYHPAEARIWRSEALLALGRSAEAAEEARAARTGGGDPNFYAWIAEGLAGGDRAAAACAAKVPGVVRARVARLTRAKTPRAVLAAILRLSKGLRRSQHELALWLPARVVARLSR